MANPPRIPIVLVRIRHESVRHRVKPSERGVDHVVQQVIRLGRIRLPFVADSEVQCQAPRHFPVVLNIRRKRGVTEMAPAVGTPWRNVHDAERVAGQEIGETGETPVAVILIRRQVIDSLITEFGAELNGVAAPGPNHIVALREFVLGVLEIGNDAGSQCTEARYGDGRVLAVLPRENLQRGRRGGLIFTGCRLRKRSAERVYQGR